ncbi:glycolate oxidase [Caldanaerobacter subterraneus subsp. tengcongensis MB4]|uniref:FAD/FMN-containing dehydrogenases n=2 Tax=Caldanaerobacter subterraneus TaxID=911092 RepID=Q8RD26_CALS4|nr:FAD-linked oxidase C-terminal domain-containing protein [Caldanaerobacter subterraneus]AAM23522.1 FAD/FMN-containing dehydrogenases [Caldanaerobacter subterraneus subsp. tengcongensis MB4]KKC30790.1 FAD/FMN-containing dehydrogenase [Caldanaerobacter subterraneus subsp. pacificus DSM 12653]MCS3916997.1 glycolate oxidase [Caldanaerobacter subterraneus subsp. tengcongensis MB4]
MYNKLTNEIVEELKKIVGTNNVIYDDPDALEAYSHDEVAEKHYAHMPEAVVKPSSAEEIARIMKLANKYKIPITPRGAGSGLSGGAVPVYGGIVLSVERMNRILEIDKENLVVVVEPGVVTNEINNAVKEYGLFYAGYPMSVETCYIGGNVAENAGGGRAVKYGVTGRYVIGLEVVTPTGDIVHLGGKVMKDVTGYDLIHLMVGSEGTLGIFTKIYLKLMPLPQAKVDLLVLFHDMDTAIKVVPKIMTFGRIIPTSIEFMDDLSFKAACKYLNEKIPFEEAGAMLLIELDGNNKTELEEQYEIIGNLCMENGAIEVYVADNATTSERIWRIRRNIAEAWKQFSPHQSLEDVVVPISEIPTFLKKIREISNKYRVPIPCYGHAGDGNIHATPIKPPELSMEEWHEKLEKLLEEMYVVVKELGGVISGEHGIGHKRKKYLPLVLEPAHIEMMRAIKKALDPDLILNPGKII